MGIRNLFLYTFLFSVLMIKGQESYIKLESSGSLPDNFIELSSAKYKKEKISIDSDDKRHIRKAKDNFYLSSNFEIRDILYSGIVLFNDPISSYCTEIFKNVIKNNKEKYEDIQIYVLKSHEVNAFAADQGIIFVTLGLIERLNSEAELAFIIAHELAHYVRKDNIQSSVEDVKIDKNKGDYKSHNYNDKILAKHSHSREAEKESDIWGYKLLSTSDYNTASALKALNILKYSYLPYDNKEVDFNLLLGIYINKEKMPDFSEVNAIDEREEDFPDEKSSHPNIAKRKKYLSEQQEHNTGKDFIQSKEEFDNIKRIAREEIALLYLKRHQYTRAIYQSLLNIDNEYDVQFNSEVIGKTLYLASLVKSTRHFKDIMLNDSSVEGNSHLIYQMLSELSEANLKLLALSYNYQLYSRNPQNKETQMIIDNLVKNIKKNHSDSLNFNDISSLTSASIVNDNFNTLLLDEIFTSNNKETETHKITYTQYELNRKNWGLNIDKMVYVNPVHTRFSYNFKKTKTEHIDEETSELELNSYITDYSNKLNLEPIILDDKSMQHSNIGEYNQYCTLQDWRSFFAINKVLGINCVNIFYYDVVDIAEKLKTPHFCWTGYLSIKYRDPMFPYQVGVLATTIPVFYLIGIPTVFPIVGLSTFLLVKRASRTSDIYFYYSVIDIVTGDFVINSNVYIPKKDKKAFIKANLYEHIQHTKN